MKALTVIAVDDEGPALRRLCKMVNEYVGLNLIASAKNSVEAINEIIQHNPDILLLDIQLKDATAFDVLSKVNNKFNGKIIFITAYDQYAVKAFEFEAIDYLLKPYTKERFDTAINKITIKKKNIDIDKILQILATKRSENTKMLMIPEGVKNYFISKEKLQYIYSETYYANFVLKNDKKLVRISLKKLDEILPSNFIRINKSTIINQFHIIELINNKSSIKIVMPDGNEFQISDTYIDNFRDFLNFTTKN